MNIKVFLLPLLFLLGAVFGWYVHNCPQCPPCAPVVQQQPVKVETQLAAPALDAERKFADREKALQTTIDGLRHQAASKPRTVTVTRTVPASCKEYIPNPQPAGCLDEDDLGLLQRARDATLK